MEIHIRPILANLILTGLMAAAAPSAWAGWVFDTPAGTTQVETATALAIGTTGTHILYSDQFDVVHHANRVESNPWTDEPVATSIGGFALALDPVGNPHIAFVQASNNTYSLIHGVKLGSVWSYSASPADQAIGQEIYKPSMAIAADGTIHIAYRLGAQVKHASCPQGNLGCSWSTQIVAGPGSPHAPDPADSPSLALKPNGTPGISYYDTATGGLWYTEWNGSSWILDIVDSGVHNVGSINSLAYDASGVPQIAYYDETSSWVLWTSWEHGQPFVWTNIVVGGELVDTGVSQVASLKVFIDSNGGGHVAYNKSGAGSSSALMFATRTAGGSVTQDTWSTQTVDSTGYTGYGIGVASDSVGNPAISYVWTPTTISDYQLKYATYSQTIIIRPTPICCRK